MRALPLVASFAITIALGRVDEKSNSIADVFRWQNVPAIIIYTAVIYVVILMCSRVLTRFIFRR